MDEQELFKREVLSYLGHLTRLLKGKGPQACGELAVQLGNFLLFVSHELEKTGPKIEQPLDEAPTTIYALAKQFKRVGVDLWNQEPRQTEKQRLEALEVQLASLACQIASLQEGGKK
jgi:hypothetical protein